MDPCECPECKLASLQLRPTKCTCPSNSNIKCGYCYDKAALSWTQYQNEAKVPPKSERKCN